MPTTTPRNDGRKIADMSREECMQLLGYGSYFGRVGFVAQGRPMILPVNYVLDNETVVFRTVVGTALSGLDGEVVAFEVDNSRPFEHGGRSVVVQGTAALVKEPEDLEQLQHGPLRSWAWTSADQWFRISIENLSGRTIAEG